MKLITHTSGVTFAFGFNMQKRQPEIGTISFDNGDGDWGETAGGGFIRTEGRQFIEPEFVIEHDGKILAYQPGLMAEFTWVGKPMQWEMRLYRAER